MIDPHQQTSRPRFHPLVVDLAPGLNSFRQATPAADLFINGQQVDYHDLVYCTGSPRPTLKINGVDTFSTDYSMLKKMNAALDAAGAPKRDASKNGKPYLPDERLKLLVDQLKTPPARLAWTYGEPFVKHQADGTFVGGYMRTFTTSPTFPRINTTWAELVKRYFPGSTDAEAKKWFRDGYYGTWCIEPRSTDEKPKPKRGAMLVKNGNGKYAAIDLASVTIETDPSKKVTYCHSGAIVDDLAGSVAFTIDVADCVATGVTTGPLLALKHSIEDGIEQSVRHDYGKSRLEPIRKTWDAAMALNDLRYGLYRVDTKGDHASPADRVEPALLIGPSVDQLQDLAKHHFNLADGDWIIDRVEPAAPAANSVEMPKQRVGKRVALYGFERFVLATGRYCYEAWRFEPTDDRLLTYGGKEPGYLMMKARSWGLKHGDVFKWRVFDRDTGESINALTPIDRPVALPAKFPMPLDFLTGDERAVVAGVPKGQHRRHYSLAPVVARGLAYRIFRAAAVALLGAGAIALLYHLI